MAEDRAERLELIEKALAVAPADVHLLYAKACAIDDVEVRSGRPVTNVERFGKLHPSHFDVSMRTAFRFKRPLEGNWQSLFEFDPWSKESTQLTRWMGSRLDSEMRAQIVRHCLTPAIAIVWRYGRNRSGADVADKSNRLRWEVRWARTPYGKIAAHYVIAENGCFTQEAFLPPAISNPLSARDGYCILRRLALVEDCFIIIADKDGKVCRNEVFVFPQAVRDVLSEIERDLAAGEVFNPLVQPLDQATKWYMDHTDFDSIVF
jgi:hypothetical protein